MKKTGIAILVLLIGVGILFYARKEPAPKVTAADFLPADIIFYGEQLNFTEMYKGFLESSFGKVLVELDYEEIASELGGSVKAVKDAMQNWHDIQAVLSGSAFNEIMGKEFSLAFYPGISFATKDPAKVLEERLLLIAKPRHNIKFLQFLPPLLGEDIQHSTVQYGSYTINRFKIDQENTLSLILVEGVVIAALNERLVRKSLDNYDEGINTLSRNNDFVRLRESCKGAKLFQYVSLPSLVQQGRMFADNLDENEKQQFNTVLDKWGGVKTIVYAAWREDGKIKEKIEILFDKEKLDNKIGTLFGKKPTTNKTLEMVPAESLFYYWTNSLDLPLLWKVFSTTIARNRLQTMDIFNQELKNSVGVEIDEILQMVGDECGLTIKEVDGNGIPIPKVLLLIELRKAERFMVIFNKLLANAEIPMTNEQYKGQALRYWGVAPQSGLQPAYTLVDDYLLLANSRDMLKLIIDLQDNPDKRLLNSLSVQELKLELTRKYNSSVYMDIAHLADTLKDLAIWASGIAVLQGEDAARKAEAAVNQLIIPLLDGVSMYTRLASGTVIGKDSIIINSTTLVDE